MNPKTIITAAAVALTAVSSSTVAQDHPAEQRIRRRTPIVEVFEKIGGAVVNISSTKIVRLRSPFGFDDPFFDEIFQRRVRTTSLGSGVIIHHDGYIVTNAHVIARATEIRVTLADKRQFIATVISSDEQRDLAVLKINAGNSLPFIKLGRSDDLMIGETVVAVGNPFGLGHTLSAGVVSGLNRELRFDDRQGRVRVYRGLIQTDAAINPGNSGGPLLNILGELVGINTAIRGDAQNIGFAIPVDQLKQILPQMLDFERRGRVAFGLRLGRSLNPGVEISEVVKGSPAEKRGIKAGDVLLQIDNEQITSPIDYQLVMAGRMHAAGVRLKLRRAGRLFSVVVPIKPIPKPDTNRLAWEKFGMRLRPITAEMMRAMSLPTSRGLMVEALADGSPAWRAGLRLGDIIYSIGRHYVADMDEMGMLLEQIRPGQRVLVGVIRREGPVIYKGATAITARKPKTSD